MDVKGKKVYVLPVPGRNVEVVKISDMVAAAGGNLICKDTQDLKDWAKCVAACDVVVLLICPESNTDEIRAIIEEAARLGKQIVGIWLDDAQGDQVPVVLDRVGDAVIVASKEAIKEAVIDGKSIWQTPAGKRRPDQKTPRHKGH